MKAVNLIPTESRRATGVQASWKVGPGYAALALLAVAVVLVTVYVLTSNSISSRKADLASLQSQVAQVQVQATKLAPYAKFVKLAEQRAVTVRQIAGSRFDWHAALGDLSQVVPANTSLQSLVGTVGSGASVSGAGGSAGGGASTGSLRSAISAPAFEMKGCTRTQDDVARLMSRLRVMNGVQRVTLADSLKGGGASSTAATSSGSGCANGPNFDLVVFYQPMAGATAGPAGGAPGAPAAATTASSSGSKTSSTPNNTPSGASQRVSNATSGSGGSK
jgi:Tfp pilus assembly protein PilN